MLASVFQNPIVVGIAVGLPSIALGYLGFRQSQKVDAIAAQAGIATVESGTIGHVIDGLNKLVANLQGDNAVLRAELSTVNEKLSQVIRYCEELKQQLADLRKRIPQTSTS